MINLIKNRLKLILPKNIIYLIRFIRSLPKKFKIWRIYFKAKNDVNKIRNYIYKNNNLQKIYTSKNRKVFCILEQGNSANYTLTKIRKEIFNTPFSDSFRLNWANNNEDKLADFYAENICWSEGRSFLYEKVKGNYDFYIFIDDDVDIKVKKKINESLPTHLKNQLQKYAPIHGSIPNDMWPDKYLNNNFGEKFLMKGGDLCVQIFRDDFAKFMFPTWNHGSENSMWYCQFIAHILFPNQSIYLNEFKAFNTRRESHCDRNLPQFNNKVVVNNKFIDKLTIPTLKKLYRYWREYTYSTNIIDYKKIYNQEINFDVINELFK